MGSLHARDTIYATCSDAQVKDNDGKRHDPMLKLYNNRPLCINHNIDAANCIANGAMCKFKCLNLKKNCAQYIEKILIDGFYVNCIEACHVHSIVVEMMDGNHDPNHPKTNNLSTKKVTPSVHFPMACDGPITKKTTRIWRKIKMEQFPVNCGNARTVHKLQGRSIENMVVSNWNYTDNWVYVVLSRCSSLDRIFLRKPLKKSRPMSDACKKLYMEFREEKCPKKANNDMYRRNYN